MGGLEPHAARAAAAECSLFGVRFHALDLAAAADTIIAAANSRVPMTVSSLAVHGMMLAVRDAAYREIVNGLDLLCADGHPVRWLLNREARAGLTERVCGTDLMDIVCARCAAHGVGVYLYGSTPKVVSALARRLRAKHASLRVCGAEPSLFRTLSAEEDGALVERIAASGASVVFVGLGCPLQETFAHAHANRTRAVQVCVGAAFDFLSGNKPRAPRWMQHSGLEWLHRLLNEPRRLGPRYVSTNFLFLWLALRRELRRRSCS